MTGVYNNKTSRLFDRDTTDPQESFSFATDDEKYSIKENITSLDELQTLSDLAAQLQNSSGRKRDYLTGILIESQTLLINSLTDNLNEAEKSEAAGLIANIITMNPYPNKLLLEYNSFSGEDLAKIISAVKEAKDNSLLQSQLTELHLRGSIPSEHLADIAYKLLDLTKRHSIMIDLDHDIQLLLSENEAKQFIFNYKNGCENYLNFLAKSGEKSPAAIARSEAVKGLLTILEGAQEPAVKKENFDSEYQRFKLAAATMPLDPREDSLIKKIVGKAAKSRNTAAFFEEKSADISKPAAPSHKKLKL
jgi:hypothetical protein